MHEKKIKSTNHENSVMTVKLKEKDQEVKLNDLKIRELKKTIPNTRLRPLRNKRMTLDSQYSGT